MSSRLELAIRNTDRVVSLSPGQSITAGRTAQCDVQIDDPSVSRRHCPIAFTDGLLQVKDLDSANGTFINERPVKEATARPGDLIRLGAAILEVRDPSGLTQRPDQTVFVEESTVESIIQRRIEPSSFDWLAPPEGKAPELALLKRAQRHLSTLHKVSEALSTARDMQKLSDVTLRAILDVLSADRGAVVLRRADSTTGEIEVLAARSKTQSTERFAVSRTLVASVIADGVSVFAHDASSDARFSEGQSVIGQRVRSVMCVPLRTTDEILGALYVDSLSGAGRFNESDLELLAAIGNQAGVAMHRVRLMGELERLLLDTIKAIAATIDARDGYTHRHSERVAAFTAQLALEMGLSESERQTAELSALLHDVGKIAVPDSILNKPGKLTPEEFAEMQKHPVHGAQILGNIQSATVKAVLPGVQYHHEKWDGTGYPEGLKAEAIPFLGRLLGVADFYDALTSARAYRGAMPANEAIKLIQDGAGKHFDPAVAAAAMRLFDRGELQRRRDAVGDSQGPAGTDAGMIRLALLVLLAQFWCPMHPDERSEVRGKCGICGMTLVRMPPATFVDLPGGPARHAHAHRRPAAPDRHASGDACPSTGLGAGDRPPVLDRPRAPDAPLRRRRRPRVLRARAPGAAARRRLHARRPPAEGRDPTWRLPSSCPKAARRRPSSRCSRRGGLRPPGEPGDRRRAEDRRRHARQPRRVEGEGGRHEGADVPDRGRRVGRAGDRPGALPRRQRAPAHRPRGSDRGDPWPSHGREARACPLLYTPHPSPGLVQAVDSIPTGWAGFDGRSYPVIEVLTVREQGQLQLARCVALEPRFDGEVCRPRQPIGAREARVEVSEPADDRLRGARPLQPDLAAPSSSIGRMAMRSAARPVRGRSATHLLGPGAARGGFRARHQPQH